MRSPKKETSKVGKKGVITIPAPMRLRFGITVGSLVIAEEREDGIFLRPAVATPVEIYSDKRVAEFLLSNTSDLLDYESARDEVKNIGLDPDSIAHLVPAR